MANRKNPEDNASSSSVGPAARELPRARSVADLSDAATATAAVSVIEAVEEPSGDPAAARARSGDDDRQTATEVLPRADTQLRARGGTPELSATRNAPLPDPARRRLWGLRMKFNAALLFAFGVGLALASFLVDRVLKDNAREEVLQEARIMIESALSARDYTADHIKPLLEEQMKERFLPEAVSAYAASQIFLALRGKFPDYTYKEATLNPRNPANRANDWESDLVQQFRNHPERAEIVIVRETPAGGMLHLARPLIVEDRDCLLCHGTVEEAPKPMTDIYGTSNGFGWMVREIVGAQVVTVPVSVPMARARETLSTFLLLLGGVFGLLLLMLNVLLHFIVIQPVVRMARTAIDVSLGKSEVPEFVLHGKDEIASLSQSFHRMRLSLEKAMKMLDE